MPGTPNPTNPSKNNRPLAGDKTVYTSSESEKNRNDTAAATNESAAESEPQGHIIDPDEEYRFWESAYVTRDYINRSLNYETDYAQAYRYGLQLFTQYGNREFTTLDETQLRSGWKKSDNNSALSWEEAREAVRDAYERLLNR